MPSNVSTAWLSFIFSGLIQLLSIPSSYYVWADCFQRLFNLAVTVVNLSYRVKLDLTLSFSSQMNLLNMFHTHYPSIDIYTTEQIKTDVGECFNKKSCGFLNKFNRNHFTMCTAFSQTQITLKLANY